MEEKSPERQDEWHKIETLARWLDTQYIVPGTNLRFGWDSIIGIIPGIGDTLTLALSAYIWSLATRYGLPGRIKLLMLWNIFIDWLIGLIPLLGDFFDFGWQANRKNVKLLHQHARLVKTTSPSVLTEKQACGDDFEKPCQ